MASSQHDETQSARPSSAIEDYLKCIYGKELSRRKPGRVPTGEIAAALQVAPGTVTTMVKAMAGSGLLSYERYCGVELTDAGRKLACHVLRRHRIVELFLVEFMAMDWSEVHTDADRLEHAVSDRVIDRMYEMLGSPAVDPHGDPIPSAAGTIDETVYPTLLTCPVGQPVRVVRILDQRREFLRLLEDSQLVPGNELTVISRSQEAEAVVLRPGKKRKEVGLGFRAATRILVRPGQVSASPA